MNKSRSYKIYLYIKSSSLSADRLLRAQKRQHRGQVERPFDSLTGPSHTLGQKHKKHSIALLGLFVLNKGPNRGIEYQFDILEKNPKGDPFRSKKFSSLILLKFHVSIS